MKYKISIIIPIYNIEKHLEKTLNSLINQTIGIENLEIIMVNDCSTDSTAEIIKKYTSKYKNFIDITLTENSGLPGLPRNIGLERSNSDFVMFMDHDDYYSSDAFEILFKKITDDKVDIVFCNFNYVYDDGTIQKISKYKNLPEIKLNTINDDIEFLRLSPSIWTKIFRKSFLNKNNIRFPEEMLAEDVSFVTHSFLKAKGIIYLNQYYGYNYRIRDSDKEKSTIYIRNKKYLHAMILGYYDTYNILKEEKKESFFPIIFNEHLEYWLTCFITGNTTKAEKLELLNEVVFLFNKVEEYGFKMDESYRPLFDKINKNEFEDAIIISNIISSFKEREMIATDRYKKLQMRNNDLQKQLNSKKNQVAKLQTIKGWSSYKTKNMKSRFKKIIKK